MTNRSENRHVWVFREMRSGGTGFASSLSGFLAKKFHFVEETLDNAIFSSSVLNNAHNFSLIPEVVKKVNPLLIRCTRRNKVEQFLSKEAILLSAEIMPEKALVNVQEHTTKEQIEGFNELAEKHQKIITEAEVIGFAKRCLKRDHLWKEYASLVENETVYYEDLLHPITIPIVDLYKVRFLNGPITATQKMPEYKHKLFPNYDQVTKWMKKYYYEHRS